MKRTFFTGLLSLCSLSGMAATDTNDTIIVAKQPQEVVIETTDDYKTTTVTIKGRHIRNGNGEELCDSVYRYSYKLSPDMEHESLVEERANSWDFYMILGGVNTSKMRSKISQKQPKKTYKTIEAGGIGFGFVNTIGAPKNMQVDMAASKEIFFDVFSLAKYYNYKKHKVGFGMGFHWRNYRMTGKTRFEKQADQLLLSAYPEGSDIDYSRIKVFSITFPLQYEFNFHKDFSLSAAAILNVNTYASMETAYKLNGEKKKNFTKHIHHTPVSVDLRASLHWKMIAAYVKYSPCKVLNTAYGPDFSGYSAGLMFGF